MGERLLAVLRYPWLEGGAPVPEAVSERAFSNHLAALWRLEWEPVGLDNVLAGLTDPDALPERAALVTFECDRRPLIESALPVLRTYRAPSVLFVDPAGIGDAAGWNELRLLESQDVSVEPLGTGPEGPATARAALESELEKRVRAYAYTERQPSDATVAAVAAAGFGAAFLPAGGVVRLDGAHPLRLGRITMRIDTDLDWETIA